MTKFVRTISLILVLVMSLGVFASCGKDEAGDTAAADNVFDAMPLTDVLAAVMNGTKESVPMTKNFADFKAFLMKE